MKTNKILLGLTSVAAIAAPIATVVACSSDDGSYNGPVVMKEYLKANPTASEIRVLGHKQELAQQLGWENIGGSQDYMGLLTARLLLSTAPVLFNVENAASLDKVKANVEPIKTATYDATTQPELTKLKANLNKLTGKNSHTTLGGSALPAWLENFGLIYNKDKMTAAGISFESIATANTNGFVATGNTAKLDQKKLNKTGLDALLVYLKAHKTQANVETVMRYPGKSGSEWVFLSHLLGASVGYASSSAQTTTPPDFQSGIDMLKNFVSLSGEKTGVVSRTADQQVGQFAAGKSFMIQQGSWMERSILDTNPGIHLGMLPLVFGSDVKSAMTTSQWWVINKTAKPAEKEQAAKMLNYLYFTQKGQQMMATAGIVPSADLKPGVVAKNKVEDAAKIYSKTYESAHTQFPKFFNNANNDLDNAYRALVNGGLDADFITAAKKAWTQTKKA